MQPTINSLLSTLTTYLVFGQLHLFSFFKDIFLLGNDNKVVTSKFVGKATNLLINPSYF